jgi:plasmid stabilization system protein ParE
VIVRWSDPAIQNLQDIFDQAAIDSPARAANLIERIINRTRTLSEFPMMGRTVPECEDDSVREIVERSYRIIYELNVTENRIEIQAVHHGKRQFPPNR